MDRLIPSPARVGRRGPLLVLLAAALVLAACSSQPSAGGHPTTSAPATSSSTSSSTTSSSSTTTTTAPSGVTSATCSTGTLQVRPSGTATSAGTVRLTFSVENAGPKPCSLDGYPVVTLYGPSAGGGAGAGPKLALSDVEVGGKASAVTLAAGGTAQFVLSVSGVPVNGGGCTTVASLQVTPPGTNESLSVPDSFQACGTTVGVEPIGNGS